jgi:hypothetical protein
MWKFLEGAAVGAGLLAASAGSQVHADSQEDHNRGGVQRVLLISIDGMHALDFINCAQGSAALTAVSLIAPIWPNSRRRVSIIWRLRPRSLPIRSPD